MLVQIQAPHFTAGLVVGERAAPILGYMRTWPLTRIQVYATKKGWTVNLLG